MGNAEKGFAVYEDSVVVFTTVLGIPNVQSVFVLCLKCNPDCDLTKPMPFLLECEKPGFRYKMKYEL